MNNQAFARACVSLDGLSVGDAFGQTYFLRSTMDVDYVVAERRLRGGPWGYTDDTLMALSVVSVVRQCGTVNQDLLARSFAERYDHARAYGASMHDALARIRAGEPWQAVAPSLFSGQGSFGNGAAMRVAPVGAYFADDVAAAVREAERSAVVTHAHDEAVAGAIAVAVGAALAWQCGVADETPGRAEFLDRVLEHVPVSEVRTRLRQGRDMTPDASVQHAVAVMGNGAGVSAHDTVPFALWCAATHLGSYEEALWLTLSGLGDRDTTCAIAGGVVACRTGIAGIPAEWLTSREELPLWPFEEQDV